MPPYRRLLLTALLSSVALPAIAQTESSFPTRPIKLMHGAPPGGSTDGPMRVLADAASRILKQTVIVENRPGAGGALPAQLLQSAAPDGYTIAAIFPNVYRLPYTTDLKWDPATDLTYIIGLTGFTLGIVVRPDSPIRTMADYIAAAKARSGEMTYGTPGIATANHMAMEKLAETAGVRLVHVPFKGTSETLNALMGGQIDSANETAAWSSLVKAGRLRLIAVGTEARLESFPDVPTLKELGFNVPRGAMLGLGAPKGTDPAIVARLHDAFHKALQTPEYRRAVAMYENEVTYLGSRDFHQYAIDQLKEQKVTLEALGLTRK